jgi:hypothetical protein
MSIRSVGAALCLCTLFATPSAFGDFQAALRDYRAGHYDSAQAQFLALAELGDCSSQFNLGAMALKAQGGPADPGRAAGWLRVAAENGCQQLVGNKLTSLEMHLSADQSRTAADIVAHYGREALHAAGIINPDFTCHDQIAPNALETPEPEYPRLTGVRPPQALVITRLTIGVDGYARDPEILLSLPESVFAPKAVEAWLNSRFTPAARAGKPVPARLEAKLVFSTTDSTSLADMPALREARTAADAGDPAAAYRVGLTAVIDDSLGLSASRGTQLLLDAARDGEPAAQYWVGSQLRASAACHARADGSVWLEHAAAAGNAAAQLLLATDLIKGTPSEAQTLKARALLEQAGAADNYYVRKHVVALLAASPLPALRDPPAALALAVKLLAGDIQSDPQMFEAAAAAYAASGDFNNALAQEQLALHKAQSLGWDTHAMNDRLAAYRGRKSWQGELLVSG